MNQSAHASRMKLLIPICSVIFLCIGLQACNNEPFADINENQSQSSSPSNLRSLEEAIEIAQRAHKQFYKDGNNKDNSRSYYPHITCEQPLVITNKSSRSTATDTLLYIVNFADDNGYAIISANRDCDELLAVTGQGHYDGSEDESSDEHSPEFYLWLESAKSYAIAKAETSIERDTTKNADLYDPDNNPLQQKEWDDTTGIYITKPQIRNSWGQGRQLTQNLVSYPEGYLFSNGLCGCGPLAIAEACLCYHLPTTIEYNGKTKTLDWDLIEEHKQWGEYQTDPVLRTDLCHSINSNTAHQMIAVLCKVIGDKGSATCSSSGTGMYPSDILSTIKYFLPEKEITDGWISAYQDYLGPNQLMLFIGDGVSNANHAWICDGMQRYEIDHIFATRQNASQEWSVQTKEHTTTKFFHFNWGWYGADNGWFNQATITTGSNYSFTNLKYILIQ